MDARALPPPLFFQIDGQEIVWTFFFGNSTCVCERDSFSSSLEGWGEVEGVGYLLLKRHSQRRQVVARKMSGGGGIDASLDNSALAMLPRKVARIIVALAARVARS